MKKELKKQIEWDLNNKFKGDMKAMIKDAEKTFAFLGGGGWYGVNFIELIPILKKLTPTKSK